MKSLIISAALTLSGSALFAQATPAHDPQAQQTKEAACSMPDMRAVQTLELSQEQMIQVREIHAECERRCAQAKAETGSIDKEAMAQYKERIKEVLTPEQYENYKALHSEHKETKTK